MKKYFLLLTLLFSFGISAQTIVSAVDYTENQLERKHLKSGDEVRMFWAETTSTNDYDSLSYTDSTTAFAVPAGKELDLLRMQIHASTGISIFGWGCATSAVTNSASPPSGITKQVGSASVTLAGTGASIEEFFDMRLTCEAGEYPFVIKSTTSATVGYLFWGILRDI